MKSWPTLYGVADAAFGDPTQLARELFAGGVRLLQVRAKTASSRELFVWTEQILADAPEGAWVIVNDRADVAHLAGAGGVHLGQDDLPAAAARRLLGGTAVIGLSTHSEEQALRAAAEPVDYLAVGPIFTTRTKPGAGPPLGLERLRRICARVDLPVVAIGGIDRENAPQVLAAGAASLAVISHLLAGPDAGVEERTRNFLRRIASRPSEGQGGITG